MLKRIFIPIISAALFTGCSEYHAPGGPADFRALGVTAEAQKAGTPTDLNAAFERKPLAGFPANVAVARLQAPGYRSETAQGWGQGAYSIVLTRDVEPEDAIERLHKLPMIRGIAPVGRLLLPAQLNSDKELREAAARLQADMLLVYTLDTSFHQRDVAKPISVITLGLSPTQATDVITTASAILMDTRSGFVYGVSEASSKRSGITTAWTSDSAIDHDRQKTEAEAFEKLVGEIEKMWKGTINEFGPNAPHAGTRYPTGG